MKQYTSKVNENIEDLLHSLTSRLDSLQSQYISFASFCSNTIASHIINVKKELNNATVKSIQSGVSKCIENLKLSYENTTSELGFSVCTKNVQNALDSTQKFIVQLNRQNLSQIEFERSVSGSFIQLSEIVTRKILKTRIKGQGLDSRGKTLSFQYMQKEAQDYKEKSEKLEKKVAQLALELEHFADRDCLRRVDNRGRLMPMDSFKNYSGINSPVTSPILMDSKMRSGRFSSKNSTDHGIDLEKFKIKLNNLAGLLEKFNFFTVKLEETISINPNLSEIVLNFKSAKSELAFALMDISNSKSSPKKTIEERSSDTSTSNEIYTLKSEYCKLKAELHQKNSEIMDLTDQIKRVENELKESRRNFITRKEEILKLEKEKEEIQLESIYLKSQIDKMQKTNKILQDTLQNQEKKTNDFIFLQSKYDEIIQDLKLKPKTSLHIEFISFHSILPIKSKSGILTLELQPSFSIETIKKNLKYRRKSPNPFEDSQNNETIYLLNMKISNLIREKTKAEEDFIQLNEKFQGVKEENKALNEKLCEALEMCKILEEFMNKSQGKGRNAENLKVVCVGSCFVAAKLKVKLNESPTKIPRVENRMESIKKSEEKVAEMEKILKGKIDELELVSKDRDRVLEELNHLKTSPSKPDPKSKSQQNQSKPPSRPSTPSLISSQLSSALSIQSSSISSKLSSIESVLSSKCSRLNSLFSSIHSLKSLILHKSQIIKDLKSDLKSVKTEKIKLLETRDKLIIQCNTQSEELISLKTEQEEIFSHKKDEETYQVQLLKNQLKVLQSSELNLNQALSETIEKYSKLVQVLNEKDHKLEALTTELSQLKFKQSTSSQDPSHKYKEEIYTLKMKNIKLEQALEEQKNSEYSLEEFKKLKTLHLNQFTKVDEDRKSLEKKLKDCESLWNKEKEALQKSLDSFTKQLAGANLEIHNLKNQLKDLTESLKPQFMSSDEYKVLRVVEYENLTWYLIQILSSQNYIWINELPFDDGEEFKDPLPNLLKERTSLQKLNSDLCAQNNKIKILLTKIENIAKKEDLFSVLNAIIDGKSDKSQMVEQKKEDVKRNRVGRMFRFGDAKTVNDAKDRESIESRRSGQSNKSKVFKGILQDKDEELMRKNDWIRKQEIGIINLKEENNKLKEEVERFQHLRMLLGRLKGMNPKMNTDCLKVFRTIVALSE